MKIDRESKVHDLIDEYPYLREWLESRAPEFEKLSNPVIYSTIGRVATLEAAAKMADLDPDSLVEEVKTEIARARIIAEELAASTTFTLDEDERTRRQAVLKDLIRDLHEGASVDDVKERFDRLVSDIDAAEIAAMEQALIAEGMPVEEVQRLCDVHVTVFRESLDEEETVEADEGHPLHMYLRENEIAGEIIEELREELQELVDGDEDAREDVAEELANLAHIATHFHRKENQLFPVLEAHGVEGPTKVMWSLDDDIIAMIKNDRALLDTGDVQMFAASLEKTLTAITDMIYKEEKILFPTALQVVTDDEWVRMAAGDAEIGYSWLEGEGVPYSAPSVSTIEQPAEGQALVLPLVTGGLTVEQINLMIGVLPFDISFVDENDRVRFYSEGERVFPRSPGVIGREVRNCHPPKSLDKVEQIISEFKAGTKSTADFWIQMGGKFIFIRYFALRAADGSYRGCLEVVQDATRVRLLEGQRRIVEWGE